MISNATAASTPSYSQAWDLAHQRMAEPDALRMDELNRDLARERAALLPHRPPEVRARVAAVMRRWRANREQPIPPCEICGGPRKRRNGSRCRDCREKDRCACGGVKSRWSSACGKCRAGG